MPGRLEDSLEYSQDASGSAFPTLTQGQATVSALSAGASETVALATTSQGEGGSQVESASVAPGATTCESADGNDLAVPPPLNPKLMGAPAVGTTSLEGSLNRLESSLTRLNSAAELIDTPNTKVNVTAEMKKAVQEVGAADALELKNKLREAAEREERVPTPHGTAALADFGSGFLGSPGGGRYDGGGVEGNQRDVEDDENVGGGFERNQWSRGGARGRIHKNRQSREGQLAERLRSTSAEFHLSGSRRRLLAQTKKMNWKEGKTASAREKHIDELARRQPPPNYLDKVPAMQKYAKNVLKFSGLDDIVNCTFQPKTRKWGQSGQADTEEEKDGEDPVAQFVKRSDAWTRKVREDLKEKVGKQDYEALLTRKICPECKMPDGRPVYQAYSEFIERRDSCQICGNKYVRQLSWGTIKDEFLRNQVKFKVDKEANLVEERKLVQMQSDPRIMRKKVFDPSTNQTRSEPLFATYRGDDEKEEIFSSFLNRTADDNRRRKEEREKDEKERLFDVTRFDPECTFRPALNKDAKYDHLTGIFERLEGQGFEERMDDDVRMRQAAARRAAREKGPIIDHLPNYLKANEGWLSDYRHPDRMPGYYDAEEAGYGGSIIAHGPFDEDRHGRPLTKMQMGNGVAGREESKHEGDGNKRLDDKVLGTGWIED